MSEEPDPHPRPSRFPRAARRLAAALGALVVAAYAVEIGAHVAGAGQSTQEATLETVLEMRRGGERAYPMVAAGPLLERDEKGYLRSAIHVDGQEVVPIGGIAGVTTLAGDGPGGAPRFTSDERGFCNPPGLWDRAPVDVLLLGDELALGAGVAPEDNVAAPVRARFPATINLGAPGLGPLAELGALREYGPLLRPRVTVILFSEGDDLRDLAREKISLLARYLERAFSQDLASRRDAVDGSLVQYEDARLAAADTFGAKARRVLELRRVRALTGLDPAPHAEPARPDPAFFRQVLREAQRASVAWEGKQLWLVYLPSWSRFAHPESVAALDRERTTVLATARGEGLHVLDATEVLTMAGDPRESFAPAAARHARHYNERGYHLLGEALRDHLLVANQDKLDIGSLPVVHK